MKDVKASVCKNYLFHSRSKIIAEKDLECPKWHKSGASWECLERRKQWYDGDKLKTSKPPPAFSARWA